MGMINHQEMFQPNSPKRGVIMSLSASVVEEYVVIVVVVVVVV